jgi:ribosomal protein L37AE/L43A
MYYIKNTAKVLPRYLIQYEFDAKREKESRQKPICEDCEKEPAVVYCEADKAYLCKTCDFNLHKTKITRTHVRTPIGQGVDVFGNCKHHPTRPIQYFCLQCHEPICIDCTIMGTHSKVDPGKHTLVSVEEYFRTVTEESKLANPQLEERKIVINEQIGNIQSRADAVVEMGKQITAKIDEICSKAKQECNQIIEKKLTVLVGDENELRRQIGEMEKLEEFLKYQQEGDSMQCVYMWHLHQMYREKLSDFKFFRQEIDVQLDAKVDGTISVMIDQQKVALQRPLNPKRPQIPQRGTPPQVTNLPSYPSSPTSPSHYSSPPRQNYGGLARPVPNLPSKMKLERKVERRTSDFFHEALSLSRDDSNDDFDSYSQYGFRG